LEYEGIHSYNSRTVAYRSDFCLSCEAPSRADQIRSLKAYRILYVPVLPLGFWREWQCSECGRDPHRYAGSSRQIVWVAVAFLGACAIVGIRESFETQDFATAWLMRLVLPTVFFIALWLALRNKPDWALAEKLAKITPDEDTTCALCHGTLVLSDAWRCSQCCVERKVLPK
jgi:hypothetical protein